MKQMIYADQGEPDTDDAKAAAMKMAAKRIIRRRKGMPKKAAMRR